jgi:hypothetical protein
MRERGQKSQGMEAICFRPLPPYTCALVPEWRNW